MALPRAGTFQWPEPGLLAIRFDAEEVLRRRLVEKPDLVMTRWPSAKAAGVPSVKSMKLNLCALECVARWWTEHIAFPKAVPVQCLRAEARV